MRLGILSTWLMVPLLAFCTLAPAQSAGAYLPSPEDFPGMEPKGSYLGIDPGEVTSENLAALKMKEETGVEIRMVDQDAPAGKAGLKEHDVILTFSGQKVEGVQQLRRMLTETPGGRTVKIGISRNGQLMDVPVVLSSRKKMREEWQVGRVPPTPPVPAVPGVPMVAPGPPMGMPGDWDFPNVNVLVQTTSRNGLMIESLTPQLAEYFGVKRGEGVLVRGVERGSSAAKAGLKAGDVIVSIDKEQISDVSDWRRVMRAKSGKVSVGIIREKRQQSVPMTVPQRKNREQGAIVVPEIELGVLDIDFDTEEFRKQFELMKPKIEEQRRLIAMQLGKQRPQIEKAIREAQQINRVELEKMRKEIAKIDKEKIKREVEQSFDREKLQKELEKARKEIAKIDTEKIKRQALAGIDQQEFEKMQQEIKKQMEEFRENLREHQKQFQMISY